jgi:hypothetical protein
MAARKADRLRAREVWIVALEKVCDLPPEVGGKVFSSFEARYLWYGSGHSVGVCIELAEGCPYVRRTGWGLIKRLCSQDEEYQKGADTIAGRRGNVIFKKRCATSYFVLMVEDEVAVFAELIPFLKDLGGFNTASKHLYCFFNPHSTHPKHSSTSPA